MMASACALIALLSLTSCSDSRASPGAAKPSRSFYGISPQSLPTTADIERMAKGRVGTLRFQLRWAAVDPTSQPADFDWSEVDQIVGDSARAGIDPLPFLFNTPDWVARELDHRECGGSCFAYPPQSNPALEAWRSFVGAAVERYGRGGEFWVENPDIPAHPIRAWQIWNEQNSPPFYRPRPHVRRYSKLLAHAASAIREVDPKAEIVLGGMFGTPLNGEKPAITAWQFLRRLYGLGWPARRFDTVAAHPYAASLRGVRTQLHLFRREMRRGGDVEGDLWITEIGWSSSSVSHPFNRGPRGQAKRLRALLDYAQRNRRELRLRRVVWFSWRDVTSGLAVCDWCPFSGLFQEVGLKPKPAWHAFTEFTGGR